MSPLLGLLDICPSVGESIMHQALPVPDWPVPSALRMDRAAIISNEFWKRCLRIFDGAMARRWGYERVKGAGEAERRKRKRERRVAKSARTASAYLEPLESTSGAQPHTNH